MLGSQPRAAAPPAEALYHPGISGERRVQDLDRHVALEGDSARVHPPEPLPISSSSS